MLNLDEFTKNLFEGIRDCVPIIDSDSSAVMYHNTSLHDANGLVGNDPFQNSSLPFSTARETTFVSHSTDVSEHPAWDTVVPQNVARRPHYLGRAPHCLPLEATSDPWAADSASVRPPTITRSNRRMADDSSDGPSSKRSRIDGLDAVGRTPSLAYGQPVSDELLGGYNYTEGNALRHNNFTTRTFDCEESFLAVDSVPVPVQSSAQGLWPMMPSSMASQRHPTQMPYMAARYRSQNHLLPFDVQPLSTMRQTNPQFNSMPNRTTEYGFNFSQPPFTGEPFIQGSSQALSWGLAQQHPQRRAQAHRDETSFQIAGPSRFPGSDYVFPPRWTSFETAGYSLQPSLAPVVEQHSQGQPVEQRSFRAQSLQHSSQAHRTSAPFPKPLPTPVSETPLSSASQASTSSSSGARPSNSAPKKRTKKAAQMPFSLAKAKCYLCRKGFRRGSELHAHWKTNVHRLRVLEAANPGVVVTAADLPPNCVCPSCGSGYTTRHRLKIHLKKCRGRIEPSESGSEDGETGSQRSTE